ncbi:MAG TPA: hypothetical protein VEZ41_08750 [Allosphingosinicella sp.]|jgi:hypothetical protein|nr:hypothetical protein [Allosphingosinicella sp.]
MLAAIAWLVLAAIHLLPALALLRPQLITALYGVESGSVGALLLQHRAALFGVVLLVCLWAAFQPDVRRLAVIAVAISMISFLILYWGQGSPPALRMIAIADLVGLPFLALAAWQAFRSDQLP